MLQVVTTHLGTSPAEREAQVEHLLGAQWLAHPHCRKPVVFCGDFNSLPGSRIYRRVCARFRDAQLAVDRFRPKRTWFGPLPLTRIDHVFVDDWLAVRRVEVPRTTLSRIASDHLPLAVDLEIAGQNLPARTAERGEIEPSDALPA
jgi:endonuclease/exonuclease/phosphatase family metal-dependent hydrolase